jgi:hypothetical protein
MTIRQHTNDGRSLALSLGVAFLGVFGLLASGCGPDMSAVANRLRKENLDQRGQIQDLQERVKNRDALIRDLQDRLAARNPPLPTLPPERLAQVFTAARLEFRTQTDAGDLAEGRKGFRVFLRTYTDDGQIAPASGALTIEAFELPPAPAAPRRIGTWTFTAPQMKAAWYTGLGTDHFAFSCAWDTPPALPNIVFKAQLVDALTGQTLEAQLEKKVSSLP